VREKEKERGRREREREKRVKRYKNIYHAVK